MECEYRLNLRKAKRILALLNFVLIIACNDQETMQTIDLSRDEWISMVKNEGAYESYVSDGTTEFIVMNLAFNHPDHMQISKENVSFELLPKTDLVDQMSFDIDENPPQGKLKQKALVINLKPRKPGTHVYNQIKLKKGKEEKIYDLGNLNIRVRSGSFSGLTILTQGTGVFPESMPYYISARNANDYPVKLKDIVLQNPDIQFDRSDIKIGDGYQQTLPLDGYEIKPNETLPIRIDWKVHFPKGKIINIETRPVVVSEYKNKLSYAGAPNIVFRNDFSY